MQTINVKGYGSLNFPDSMTQAEMQSAIHSGIQSGKLTPIDDIDSSYQPKQGNLITDMSGIPGAVMRLAPDAYNLGNIPVDTLKNRAIGLGRGFTEIGQGAKQLGMGLAERFGFLPEGTTNAYTQNADRETQQYEQSPAGQDKVAGLLRNISASLPYAALGPLVGAELPLARQMIIGGAMGGGLGAAKYAPEGTSRFGNIVENAALGAAAPIVPAYLGGTGRMLPGQIPSRVLGRFSSSPLSREELLRNLEVTKGTETGLGEVIGAPTLKRLQENVFTKVPLTGGTPTLQRTGKMILDRGDKILEDFRNNVPHENVSENLATAFNNAAERETENKNALYRSFNQAAEKNGVTVAAPSFAGLANKYSDALESTNILQFEPEVKSLINRIRNYKNPVKMESKKGMLVDASGQPLINETTGKELSAEEANILSGKLITLGKKYGASSQISDRNAAKIFGQLGRALKQDVKNAVYGSKNKDVINKFTIAENNYKKNFSGFLDNDVYRATHGGKAPEDVLSAFLKTSKIADKSGQLNKLMSKLSHEEQDLVRYGYFSRALSGPEDMRTVNPNKLATLWNNLGSNQKRIFMPDITKRREMDNFVKLVGMNQKAVNMMWNPATGQMNSDFVTALMIMNPMKALPEVLAGRIGNKLLTNEDTRNIVVKSILKRRGESI